MATKESPAAAANLESIVAPSLQLIPFIISLSSTAAKIPLQAEDIMRPIFSTFNIQKPAIGSGSKSPVMSSEAIGMSMVFRRGKYSGLQGLTALSGKSLQTVAVVFGPSFHFRRFMIRSSG
jgi:hypothetical protein